MVGTTTSSFPVWDATLEESFLFNNTEAFVSVYGRNLSKQAEKQPKIQDSDKHTLLF